MLRQLFAAALTLVSISASSLPIQKVQEECVATMEESCNPSGYIPPTFLEVEITIKPNSCKGDCNFTDQKTHQPISVDTNIGRVFIAHGSLKNTIPVPKGHKLISCYCSQPECIILAPFELQYFGPLTGKDYQKGGKYTLIVPSKNLMD